MPPKVPTTFYNLHVRLVKDFRQDPPKLICCVTIWVKGGEKLIDVAPTSIENKPHTIIRYSIVSDNTEPFKDNRWEHFEFEWPWPDYHMMKLITNVIAPSGTSATNSSDRAEPLSS